jgi:hypothetical protein
VVVQIDMKQLTRFPELRDGMNKVKPHPVLP